MAESKQASSPRESAEPVEIYSSNSDSTNTPDFGLLSGDPSENLTILRSLASGDSEKKTPFGDVSIVTDKEDSEPPSTGVGTSYGAGFERLQLSPEQEAQVNDELESGKDPSDLLAELAQDDSLRVIAFGETHYDQPMQDLTVEAIEQLAESGFTHLALELDSGWQDTIDQYMESGDEAALREAFHGSGQGDYWMPRIVAAREAGLEVAAVDQNPVITRQPFRSSEEADAARKNDEEADLKRDQAMFEGVDEILASDPNARVILIGGSGHYGSRALDQDHPTLGQLLKDKYPGAVATILSQTDTAEVDTLFPFLEGLEGLEGSLIVPTHSSDGESNAIGDLPRNQRPLDKVGSGWYRDWDYVAMFPD